jgi:hypothetical protein
MAVSLYRNDGRELTYPWGLLDEAIYLIHELTGLEMTAETYVSDVDAALAYSKLREAMEKNQIGLREESLDSLGRRFEPPLHVLTARPTMPLNDNSRRVVQEILAFLAPSHPQQQLGGVLPTEYKEGFPYQI